ncbi:hypothetical protein ACWIDW_12915 [Microbacterium sp. NPDC055312]
MDRAVEGLSVLVGFSGAHLLIVLVTWLVVLAIVGGALYLVVRLAVLHALKAHTSWLRSAGSGRGATPTAGPPGS